MLFSLTLLPVLIALTSEKAKGVQKLVWCLVSLFFSWLGFLVYYFFVVRGMSERNV
ncbi:PLDc N-terminal domain-containing protein [Alteromonas australica]